SRMVSSRAAVRIGAAFAGSESSAGVGFNGGWGSGRPSPRDRRGDGTPNSAPGKAMTRGGASQPVEARETDMIRIDVRPLGAAITVSLLLAAGASARAGVVCDTTPAPDASSTATGPGATACGEDNESSGSASGTFGFRNIASESSSSALGNFNVASGVTSTAIGSDNLASSQGATA